MEACGASTSTGTSTPPAARSAQRPQSASIQHASLGTTLNSTGVASGFFQGVLDEARIWNVARTGAQIQAAMSTQIGVPTAGLRGRWGMNETAGTTVPDTAGQNVTGTDLWRAHVGSGSSVRGPGRGARRARACGADRRCFWSVRGSHLGCHGDRPRRRSDERDVLWTSGHRSDAARLHDRDGPDTQLYSENAPRRRPGRSSTTRRPSGSSTLGAQYNTQFVTHLGDIVDNYNVEAEWISADAAQDILDNADVPNAVAPGNHDVTTAGVSAFYDQYFPPSRYSGESWYGGYLGDPSDTIADPASRLNKDNYQLFEVGSLKFLMVSLEVGMPQYSVDWAEDLVQAYPDRRVIITTHAFIDANGNRPTSAVHRPDGLSAQTVWTTPRSRRTATSTSC